ncbi:hypothetical protein EMIHUDRAFT_441372 [Emiliania huxleyi CCMP1516]|uniref:Glycosyl transferase CAP10 domain-containing protein n=2 Tax=Emiliania huxleyi TaxID=2903 RepID=A0A0D3KE91_EMIH1|nr:hypothetical protein EMIHUDRAFT_441372 [Emiliania huxleyi CCMP1516]EOD34076.1 hypothetical protein EMIHUDRAFT_441372 [Emiliania huxleyi CCMP1516]|eukprot:XP_005786505.1 hypothetical protein EMIHUDRAFT_441372 [Emiliania huxleyi CCMP1516]
MLKLQPASLAVGVVFGLIASLVLRPEGSVPSRECQSVREREARLKRLEIEVTALRDKRAAPCEPCAPAAAGALSVTVGAARAPPPPLSAGATHHRWYWTDLVLNSLRPFAKLNGGITRSGLRLAEQKCKISTWCHRAQVIGGRLYITDIRAIFFDRNYAMARVMPLLLTLKAWPNLPDLDAVFSGTDYPIMEIPRDAAHMMRMYGARQAIPPVFSPTANSLTHDLPWPDFSFFPPRSRCGKACTHPLKTPRWQESHPNLAAMGKEVGWDAKIDRAVFTGHAQALGQRVGCNMKTSPNRRAIYHYAEQFPELLMVNEVYIKTTPPSCFEVGEPNVTRGGVLQNKCGFSFKEMCRYRYLLNVGSNGYANKLKYLFLCGSVVIWVRTDSLNYEFFEKQFLPGVHYAAADTVDDVPDVIRELQRDPEYARSLAQRGFERMLQMDTAEVTHYCYEMLKGYAALQRFTPKRDPRSIEINCEDDLIRHYDRGRGDTYAGVLQERYLTQDNSTCLRPPSAGAPLGPPGWGGAFNGTKPPCLASHDLAAKEEVGVCDKGTPQHARSGRYDGPDWDVPEAYKGGALPDWTDRDPADSGKGARVNPYNPNVQCS